MAYATSASAAAVYAASARWVDRALRAELGVFSDRPIWTSANLAGLRRLLAERFDRGDTFDERWRRALDGAPDDTLQLAAELLWVHVLFPTDLTGKTKRRLLIGTLELASQPVAVPPELDAVLDGGIAPSGIAYKARRRSQLGLLLDATSDLKRRTSRERDSLLADAWACKAWLAGIPSDGGQSQREVLLHLLHPSTFEPIVSVGIKRRIAAAFAQHVPAHVDDVDEALLHIRGVLEREHGRGFGFADPVIEEQWK